MTTSGRRNPTLPHSRSIATFYSSRMATIEKTDNFSEDPEHYPLAESTSCSSQESPLNDDQINTDDSIVSDSEESSEDEYDLQLVEAQRQWEESLAQLNRVLNWVILPLLGKFVGRRCAVWTWKYFANKLFP